MNERDKSSCYLIAPDGGLRTIPAYLVDDLRKKGWRVVVNPKRTYFPEYDVTHPAYQKPVEKPLIEENPDMLQIEAV